MGRTFAHKELVEGLPRLGVEYGSQELPDLFLLLKGLSLQYPVAPYLLLGNCRLPDPGYPVPVVHQGRVLLVGRSPEKGRVHLREQSIHS